MKFLTTLLTSMFAFCINAQTDSNTGLNCDSVKLLSGDVNLLQVQEIKRTKIVYFLCCEDCAVPRTMKLNLVDTIIYSPESKFKNASVPMNHQYSNQNLLNSSQGKLDLYLKDAQKTKKTGQILTFSGLAIATTGLIIGFSTWDLMGSGSQSKGAKYGSMFSFLGGSALTLTGLPIYTLGLIRGRRIKLAINNNSTGACLEFLPSTFYNSITKENQVGLNLRFKF